MAAPTRSTNRTTIIGIDKAYFAPMVDENLEQYDTPFALDPIQSFEIEPETNTATQYGDNIAIEVASAMGSIEGTVTFTGLSPAIEGAILGHTVDATGKKLVKAATDIAPMGAFMYRRLRADGGYRYKILYRGRFSVPSESTATKEDSVEFQSSEMTINFVPRLSDQVYEYQIDMPKAADGDAAYAAKFFAAVLQPNADVPTT